MDPQKTTTLPRENVTLEWTLCSPHFDDIILIAPERLNDLHITSQYQKIPMKQIKKKNFNYKHYIYKMNCLRRKYTTPPALNIPKKRL